MDLFKVAEEERDLLNNLYVGTEHYMLAYLKYNNIHSVEYIKLKELIEKVVGRCKRKNEYIIYTPKLRKIKNMKLVDKDIVINILNDQDSVVYNLLNNNGYDVNKIIFEVENT